MKRLLTFVTLMVAGIAMSVAQQKAPVFIYAGQSNADGREYTSNLPDYMKKNGSLPSSPYTHLHWASICGNPSKQTFDTRTFNSGERYAFCDVTNYWIDKAVSQDFYAIKCSYGGTAISPGATVEKLPIWYADAEWMQTHNAYCGQDITQEEYANNNSLTKNLTDGVASLINGTLAALDAGYDVKAIMWHQGESDRNAAGSYYENFKTMIAYMRNAIYAKTGDEADKTLPFIFGTVCRRSSQYSAGVEVAQRQVAAEDDNVYLIDMQNATLLSDNLHFDKQATEYLGKKMYNQLVTLGLVSGEQVEVEEFPVKESVMDAVEVPSPDNRSWDFSAISQTTLDALAADVALESGALWNYNSGWGYRRGNSIEEEQLHTAADYVIPETQGLYFTSSIYNRVSITSNALGFISSDAHLLIPKMVAGQTVTFTVRANKNTINVNPDLDTQSLVELVSETNVVGTSYTTVTYRVRYNVTLPTHMGFTMGGGFLQKVQVKTPETVNILIGADQKETFSCDQPLDFSPFTDLFKAYVVTGYDDATGKIDCEQVLQVPANTGVLLIGEESTMNAPIIDGTAPEAPAVNLLTAVVGSGSAPANSFVLSTTSGVTQFTKTANAVSLNNQAYIASLGSLSTYDFNIVQPRTEHVYDISGGSILSKGTTLTFGNTEHHTLTDGSTSKDVYVPTNANGLEHRFAFDNSGNWQTDGSNGSLGYTYGNSNKNNLYGSVVSLVNGDRVKIEVNSQTTVIALNGVLRGVSAGETLTSGTIYVVETTEETVDVDFKINGSSNRFGITKLTVWTDNEIETDKTPVSIAPYDGNRKAAVSYTFDDGIQDQYTLAYPEMKKRGIRATFAIIGSKVGGTIKATNTPEVPAMTWDQIREMYADGFEIASHGYNHKALPNLSEEDMKYEVDHNDDVIEQEVGQRPLTFIFPGNSKSEDVIEYVLQNHVGCRTYQQSMGGSSNELTMNSYVDGLITSGSWGVTMTHAIAEGYDQFQDPQRLYNHWDYVVTLQDELWVAPFHEVAGYVRERDNATVTTTTEDDENIVLTVSTTLEDKTMFSYPLTLLVDTYADAATQDGNTLTVNYKNGQTIVTGVNPNGGSVTIHKSSATPLTQLTKPTVSATLTAYAGDPQLRKAQVTLTGSESGTTYYYKGGDATDWSVLEGLPFEPAKKGVYTFKAVAAGYADSDPTRGIALAPLYKASQTLDLTDEELYASVTSSTDAFSWGTYWGFSEDQEFGKINTANIGIISVQNNNLARPLQLCQGHWPGQQLRLYLRHQRRLGLQLRRVSALPEPLAHRHHYQHRT